MADAPDKESQTEDATEKKIQDSLDRGNIPVTREASSLASIAAILIVCVFLLRGATGQLTLVLARLLDSAGEWTFDSGTDAAYLFAGVTQEMARFALPILFTIVISGIIASVAQNVPRFVLDRIMPDASRISITGGWGRLFGARGMTEFAKSLFKLGTIGVVLTLILRGQLLNIINTISIDSATIPELILRIATQLFSTVGVAVLLLVAADIVWSRLHWRRDLRMSKQEVKDERKEIEGDPLVRARLRSLALSRSRKRMMAKVPNATLVVANPTHYAVALRYVREEGGAPIVLAKGQDLIALKIREIAEEHDIPIIEDKALARSMYDNVHVGKFIPSEFYRAVAEIVHFLQMRATRRTHH